MPGLLQDNLKVEIREEWVGLILTVGTLASEVTLGLTIAVWEMGEGQSHRFSHLSQEHI